MYFFISRYQRELRKNSNKLIQNQDNSDNSMAEEILYRQEKIIRHELIRLVKEQKLKHFKKQKIQNIQKKKKKKKHKYYK